MLWKRGLNNNFTLAGHSAGAAGNLYQTLREPLAAAEVSAKKSLVCIDDNHECQVWKVMSFRQHLRADKNFRLASSGCGERFFHRALDARAVAVDARDRVLRKLRPQ